MKGEIRKMLRLRTELDRLQEYLIARRITHDRVDEEESIDEAGRVLVSDRHEIYVPEEGEECRWIAVCQRGSYGWKQGLIEIYGEIVMPEDGDSVAGNLTAADVIKRMEAHDAK